MLLFWAKIGKTSAYFLRFDKKLKKSRSEFDLVTVLISKQSFFQHRIWPAQQGKSYLHGRALPDFYIAHYFTKNQNKGEYLPLFAFSVPMPLPRKALDVTKEHINVQWFYLAIFEAVYGSHSQSKNGLYFPHFMYFSSYFPNFNKIFSQMCRKR